MVIDSDILSANALAPSIRFPYVVVAGAASPFPRETTPQEQQACDDLLYLFLTITSNKLCNREKPPCKYFHPPQHLKDQLLINGRNHLALKNALMQQMTMAASQQIVPGQVPTAVATPTAYLTGIPGASTQVGNTYTPYFSAAGPLIGPTTIITSDPNNPLAMAVQQTMVTQQKMPRNDRLDMDMKAVGTFYYENFAFPGMMQYKRAAGDKSGMPVFQQNTGAYQQLLQPFVPTVSFAAPPGIPRY
ncbi:unnamed protein product [Macrosiphum euphorbiae]|uniref:Muscleblind-like CCCH zinc finger domain-containing protein n=1 Tax=Macrosiphum euphorbiae TaxID=13131 RepID=A0AAV0WHE1_9HEMI|nr:unnamed protein product [Macrosiphum euphorbiae]